MYLLMTRKVFGNYGNATLAQPKVTDVKLTVNILSVQLSIGYCFNSFQPIQNTV